MFLKLTAKKPKIMNDNGEDGTTSSLTNETFEPGNNFNSCTKNQ